MHLTTAIDLRHRPTYLETPDLGHGAVVDTDEGTQTQGTALNKSTRRARERKTTEMKKSSFLIVYNLSRF